MYVTFENGEVPIWRIRPGVVVMQNGYFYHIKTFYPSYNQPGIDNLRIVICDKSETIEANPRHVEWLEPI